MGNEKQLVLEVTQPNGKVTKEVIRNLDPQSRLGMFFFPSGVADEFGQIMKLELSYADGHVRTYKVVDARVPI